MSTGILKFDEMKVNEKLYFNPHTMELAGFEGGAMDDNVIKHEFAQLARQHDKVEVNEEYSTSVENGNDNLHPDNAEYLLLFTFNLG